MPSDAVKKVQEKLFRGGLSSPQQPLDREPALTIDIPKPPPTPTLPQKTGKLSDTSPKNQGQDPKHGKSHRQRLAKELGPDYQGAEKYRLVQDGRKERHWKRWGPYLSDRQWVSLFRSILIRTLPTRFIHRLLSEKIILPMVTRGATFLTSMLDLAHIAGEKMVLLASQIITSAFV